MIARASAALVATLLAVGNATAARADSVPATYTFTVPVQLKNFTIGMGPGDARTYFVGCGVTSGTSLAVDNSNTQTATGAEAQSAAMTYHGWKSGPESTGQGGRIIGQAFTKITFDATQSYTGNISVVVTQTKLYAEDGKPQPGAQVLSGHYYLCGLFGELGGDHLYAVKQRDDVHTNQGQTDNTGYEFVNSTFQPIAQGLIQ